MTLPKPLEAMGHFNQFINWSLIAKEGQAKPTKVPVNPTTGRAIDPHDPANWMTADQAFATGKPVGFVLTDDDPFWFLDIDNCATPEGWSDLSRSLCAAFPGAAVEISQSGQGLHIFGVGKGPDGHKSRTKTGLEFYTTKRFIALGLQGVQGDIWTEWSAQLADVIPRYFDKTTAATEAILSHGPRPEWSGPTDDDELIRKMLHSKGASATFGQSATFKQLWEADTLLGQFYPDPEQNRSYDASMADGALLSHLAFWTGCDAVRMDRLFRRSGLMRPKWEKRGDYRQRSITGVVARCKNVYQSQGLVKSDPAPINGVAVNGTPTGTILTVDEQIKHFENCVYIRDLHKVFIPDGSFLKPEVFKATYGGKEFIMSLEGKTTKSAFEAFTENRVIGFPKVTGICFRPEIGQGVVVEEEGRTLVNSYVPSKVVMTQGDVTPFLGHVEKLFPNEADREIVLSYMAACIQYPGIKFQWCPVIQGAEGNGKTLLMTVVAYAVGNRYSHFPNAADIGGNGAKFNAWIMNKLFIGVEEIHTRDRMDVADAIKPLITNARIEIQGKGVDQFTGDNRANFMMCSNHRDAVKKTERDRRYAVFYTAQQEMADIVAFGMGGRYFPDLYDWLRGGGYASVAHYLANRVIADNLNPATLCNRAPATSSTAAAIHASMGVVEQEIMEAIESKQLGFKGGWVSSVMLNKLIINTGMKGRVARNKIKEMMGSLGYVPHPRLELGRCSKEIFQEQGRPVLYVKRGSIAVGYDTDEVTKAYCMAQGYVMEISN